MTAHVKDVSVTDFGREVVERSRQVPVVVDFWAAWCGPCRVLGPTLERLAAEDAGTWELAKVDVDANQPLAMQFGVQGIPTVIGFRDGQAVARFTGAVPEAQVRDFLTQLLPSELDLAAGRAQALLESGDEDGAEAAFRSVLDADPGHQDAGVGLAGLLVEQGRREEALEVLARLSPTDEVRQLQAAARLAGAGDLAELERAADAGEASDRLAYARALAAAGRHAEALELLIGLVEERDGEMSEEARRVVVDLFELLGNDHPLTPAYRRRLASALF